MSSISPPKKWGIATIAVGNKSVLENSRCVESIKRVLPDTPVITINTQLNHSDMVSSRLLKTSLINHIPQDWQYCIYLDSDTRLLSADIVRVVDVLSSGYDLVICPSEHSDFWHIGQDEINYTTDQLTYLPLQLQFGVFGFSVNSKTRNFFLRLSNEYMLYSNQDQAALVRALHQEPVRYWLFGYPFNSSNGSVINHLFGNTRNE